ncbi:MAG TPA: DUF4349 domain-containing protein, partial [Bryobacteraceae bacterium]|nr:DUF4349 domain-containing protein [Bryobacteraceae bacterium]
MNEHPLEQIDAFIAGGLTDRERVEFEAHVANCPTCAAALAEAKDMDAAVNQLFAFARPGTGFEDRIVRNLNRPKLARRWVHPLVRKVAVGVAATLFVGGIGYVGNAMMNGQPLPFRQLESRRILSAARVYMGDWHQAPAILADTPLSTASPSNAPAGAKDFKELSDQNGAALGRQNWGDVESPPRDKASLSLSTGAVEERQLTEQVKKAEAKVDTETLAAIQANPQLQQSQKQADLSYYSLGVPQPADLGKESAQNVTTFGRAGGGAGGAPGVKAMDGLGGSQDRSAGASVNGNYGTNQWNFATGRAQESAEAGAISNASPAKPSLAQSDAPKSGATAAPPAEQTAQPTTRPEDGRKVIRSGEMEFEVDNFETAVERIQKIVAEESGFVSTTESDKLPNGKVKGRVVLRCPPERLDTLVLKLRGIGDLHTQRIGAQDITKQYTDLASGLRAARAMEDRLLEIIKTGKGQVKDLLEAEKQLGVWREKIEQLEGEIRYYNNLVSLSTLTVTLAERDIQTPAFASQTETVNLSLETEKVEEDYQKARDAIDQAKGRITASELKQFDAGQYRATISAQLPSDKAEPFLATVRQLNGRLAHFERQRSQSTSNGNTTRTDPLRVKQEDVVVNLTIYNLANIAPRRTSNLVVVAANVDQAYQSLIDQVNSIGGKVVTSAITRPSAEQTDASLNFNVPADKADLMMTEVRGAGEVVKSDVTESPDSQNVTESKRGFSITLASLNAFAARESQQIQLAASDVPAEFNELLSAARDKGGRIANSQLNEQDRQNIIGTLTFWIPRDALPAIEQAFGKSAEVVSRMVTRSNDTQNTVDTKIQFQVTVSSADRLPARQTVQMTLAAASVPDTLNAIRAALPKGARVLMSQLDQQDPQNISGKLVFDLPEASDAKVMEILKKQTATLTRQIKRIPDGQIAVEKDRYEATLISADHQPPRQTVVEKVLVSDADQAADDFVAAASGAGGRQVDNPQRTDDGAGHVTSTIVMDVPLSQSATILGQIDQKGSRRAREVHTDTTAPDTSLARARIEVTFSNSAATLGGQESMGDYIRHGLLTSLEGLGYSLMWIIIGICLVAPWAI